jgi:hypothetical protein
LDELSKAKKTLKSIPSWEQKENYTKQDERGNDYTVYTPKYEKALKEFNVARSKVVDLFGFKGTKYNKYAAGPKQLDSQQQAERLSEKDAIKLHKMSIIAAMKNGIKIDKNVMKDYNEMSESVDPLEYLLSLTPEKANQDTDRIKKEIKSSQKPVLDAIEKIDKHIKDIVSKHNTLKNKSYKENTNKLTVGDTGSFNDNHKSLTISDINNRKKVKSLQAYAEEYTYAQRVRAALQKEIDRSEKIDYNPIITITKEGFLRISGFNKRVSGYVEHDKPKISKMPG